MKAQNKAGEEVNKGFEDLKAWQLARQLKIGCHELANRLPAFERHDLVSQIRRSSKSGMANIAEGYGRYHYLDSLRFYYIARGSSTETISHLITAHDLKYTSAEQHQALYDLGREAERALNGYKVDSVGERRGLCAAGGRVHGVIETRRERGAIRWHSRIRRDSVAGMVSFGRAPCNGDFDPGKGPERS